MAAILHVFAGPFPTVQGTQALVATTCRLLARAGHEIHLLCYAHRGFAREEPFAVHRLPDAPAFASERSGPSWRKVALDASLAWATRRLLARLRPRAVHAHHYEALLAAALADPLRRTPRVFHLHAMLGPELETYLPALLARPARALGRRIDAEAPRLADGIVVLDGRARDALVAAGAPAHAIRVSRIPASPPPGCAVPPPRPAVPGAPVRAVYVGNLDRYQGIDVLLAALGRLAAAAPAALTVDFVTASAKGGLAAEIRRRRLEGVARIAPHGTAADAWNAVAAADLAVIPRSVAGGVPVKLVNALAAGVPVVADREVAAELAHGEEAWLVDMRSPDALAAGLARLAGDPALRARIGIGAVAAAARLHDPATCAAAIAELYASLPARG